MSMQVFIMISLVHVVHGHMGISSINPGGLISRDTKVGDNFRFPNSGHCHGVPMGTPKGTLNVGSTYTLTMSNGAAHGGGQCSLFLAERSTQEGTWYKQMDIKDCSLLTDFKWTIKASTVPASCGSVGCTLIWVWTPINSGTCEIYINCFDLKVMGSAFNAGNQVAIRKDPVCARPNRRTGETTMFGQVCYRSCGGPASTSDTSAPAPTPASAPTQAPAGGIPLRCGTTWLDANNRCLNRCTAANEQTVCQNGMKCFAGLTRACTITAPAPAPANPNTPSFPPLTKLSCKAIGVWAAYAGMDAWCSRNCPSDCPATHCSCTQGTSTAAFAVVAQAYEPTCQKVIANGTETFQSISDEYDLSSYEDASLAEAVAMKNAAMTLLAYNQGCNSQLIDVTLTSAIPSGTMIYITGDCQLTQGCQYMTPTKMTPSKIITPTTMTPTTMTPTKMTLTVDSGSVIASFSIWTLTGLTAWLF